MCPTSVARTTEESCVSGPLPLIPDAIRIVPAKTAAASVEKFVGRQVVVISSDPSQECVEGDLLQDETPIEALLSRSRGDPTGQTGSWGGG